MRRMLLVATCLALLSSVSQGAVKRALLVGVTDYPALPKDMWLDGPDNDMAIVNDVLLARGFAPENITLLGEQYTAPTKAAIVGALEELATTTETGDFVYMHLAGHGSRQPASARDNSEVDGLDEIFLPRDIGQWEGSIGEVRNAISDDLLATYLDRIRDNGADVWVVFDSCHSGTMTRGSGQADVKYRRLDNSVLGVPDDAGTIQSRGHGKPAAASPEENFVQVSSDASGDRGALIAFSAAQTIQTTPEMKLPQGDPEQQWHGLFTYTLMQALSQHPGITYRQLGQLVLRNYAGIPWRQTQPLISGTDMDQAVFGEEGTATPLWQAKREDDALILAAGKLQNFNEDAVVAVYRSATGDQDSYVGDAKIDNAQAVSASAEWIGKPTLKKRDKHFFVELKAPATDLVLSTRLEDTRGLADIDQERLRKIFDDFVDQSPIVKKRRWGDPDIRVAYFDDALWFLMRDESLPCDQQIDEYKSREDCEANRTPHPLLNVGIQGETFEKGVTHALDSGLQRIAMGHNLIRVQEQVASLGDSSALKLTMAYRKGKDWIPFPTTTPLTLEAGDNVRTVVTNTGRKAQDVTILFKDSRYGISQLYPERGESNRLEKGEQVTFEFDVSVETPGMEDFIVISQPSTGVASDFSFLQQPPLGVATRGAPLSRNDLCKNPAAEKTKEITSRGKASQNDSQTCKIDPLAALLSAARRPRDTSLGTASRGLRSRTPGNLGGMQVVRWETVK